MNPPTDDASHDDRAPYRRADEDFDLPDPLIWLAWVAAHTSTIRLATGILILPQRNPVITAKELATLDTLSGGRLTLGVGAGWLAEEFAARRARRLGDGFFPGSASIDELAALLPVMRQAAEEADRDPDAIELIALAMAAPGAKMNRRIEDLMALGFTHAIVPTFPPDQLADIGRSLVSSYG